MLSKIITATQLTAISFLLSGCASMGLASLEDRMLYSVKARSSEVASANASHQQAVSQWGGLSTDSAAQSRVENIKNRLCKAIPRRDMDFDIYVLNSDQVNAFTTGGRQIYLLKGFLSDVRNDDELALVISHEMAHTLCRHRAKTSTIATLTTLGQLAGKLANKNQNQSVQTVLDLAGSALPASFSRSDEKEADVLAAAFAKEAGFNVDNAQGFFKRLHEQEVTYSAKVNSEFLPVLNRVTNNYNLAVNQFNVSQFNYSVNPTPENYATYAATNQQLEQCSVQLKQIQDQYLQFSLGNLGLFRTHPDSLARADLFSRLNSYFEGKVSRSDIVQYDSTAGHVLDVLDELKRLDKEGFMTADGVAALENYKKGKLLLERGKFREAKISLETAVSLKSDYEDARKALAECDLRLGQLVESRVSK